MKQVQVFIALGSNQGDRGAMIQSAIDLLEQSEDVDVVRISDMLETDPVGVVEQPRFLNAAAELRTTLAARPLLQRLLSIEAALGRDRQTDQRWGPRTIDLDLLLYGDSLIDEPGLHVPHPRMHERRFVLAPLAQIAGTRVHPVTGKTIAQLLAALPSANELEYQPAKRC